MKKCCRPTKADTQTRTTYTEQSSTLSKVANTYTEENTYGRSESPSSHKANSQREGSSRLAVRLDSPLFAHRGQLPDGGLAPSAVHDDNDTFFKRSKFKSLMTG